MRKVVGFRHKNIDMRSTPLPDCWFWLWIWIFSLQAVIFYMSVSPYRFSNPESCVISERGRAGSCSSIQPGDCRSKLSAMPKIAVGSFGRKVWFSVQNCVQLHCVQSITDFEMRRIGNQARMNLLFQRKRQAESNGSGGGQPADQKALKLDAAARDEEVQVWM